MVLLDNQSRSDNIVDETSHLIHRFENNQTIRPIYSTLNVILKIFSKIRTHQGIRSGCKFRVLSLLLDRHWLVAKPRLFLCSGSFFFCCDNPLVRIYRCIATSFPILSIRKVAEPYFTQLNFDFGKQKSVSRNNPKLDSMNITGTKEEIQLEFQDCISRLTTIRPELKRQIPDSRGRKISRRIFMSSLFDSWKW